MSSERLYTRQEVVEILRIHDSYSSHEYDFVDIRQANSLVKRMQKYPTIFEKEIKGLTKQIERYQELKKTER